MPSTSEPFGIAEQLGRKTDYRLIAQGEVIRSDDEILHDDCETWGKVNNWAVGMHYRPEFFVPMRRRCCI